jgi:hypothetical protein
MKVWAYGALMAASVGSDGCSALMSTFESAHLRRSLRVRQGLLLKARDDRIRTLEERVHTEADRLDCGEIRLEVRSGRARVNRRALTAPGGGHRCHCGGDEPTRFQTATMTRDLRTAFAPAMDDDRRRAEYGPRSRAAGGTWRDTTWM